MRIVRPYVDIRSPGKRPEAMSSDDDSHGQAAPDGRGNRPDATRGGSAAGTIVRLFDLDPRNPARVVAEMRGYWQGLRKGMAIPTRADIEPAGMRRSLDFAFILERIAPGAARFRLAGRHLIDVMGMEVRGMPLCAFFNPGARGNLSDLLETVFQGPQLVELALTSPGDYGRPALGARMLLLPLRSDLGDVTRALGCLVVEGEIGRAPRRFDIEDHAIEPVIPGARTLAPAPGFGETAEPWRSPPPAAVSRPPAGRRRAPAKASGTAEPNTGRTGESARSEPTTPEERRAGFRVISRD